MHFSPTLRRTLSAVLLLSAIPALAATHKPARHAVHKSVKTSTKPTAASAGMAPERATQIQQALIAKGYLTGEPSGHWDSESQAAMQKLQGENGWQTKITPDSRALIKLGLGPTPVTAAPQQ